MFTAATAHARCSDILPHDDEISAPQTRSITANDLVRLRDIGFPDASVYNAASPFGVSADGREVAFVISRADPVQNRYCRALVIMPVDGSAAPRVVDEGGAMLQHRGDVRGLFASYGTPEVVTPKWSPDGKWIAYLKREDGVTQIWRVSTRGATSAAVTHSAVDIEAVAWSADGKRLIYSARPAERVEETAIDAEGDAGWLYDDRITPNAGPRPRPIVAHLPLETFVIDPRDGSTRPATPEQRARPAAEDQQGGEPQTVPLMQEHDRLIPLSYRRQGAQFVVTLNGTERTCRAKACGGDVAGVWGDPANDNVILLRRQGWRNEATALYRWKPGKTAPRLLFSTDDAIGWCVAARHDLVCTRENATTPRRVVRIDPDDGASTVIFDPNPAFSRINLGSVRRLRWRNDRGLEAWGDLVLPPSYRRGERLPMIVVQYHSRGFLRGGTGDEYPIFLFAAHGFAVLSIERPAGAVLTPDAMTSREIIAAGTKDWTERRSLQSSLETGVRAAIATGAVDPARIGITGLSDGATSVRFALINSQLFAAAAISSCCIEPVSALTMDGIRFADANLAMGYPGMNASKSAFWAPMSLALNADRINVPLLMQLSDDEYLLSLEAFEALREAGKPVEMYVFPDEHHNKWQPRHRLAIYRRNVDWFDFWLRSTEHPDPAKRPQYMRWRQLRALARR
ncbi:MAG TPA: Atxe2 family lasso peptide isopeptidase [Sphingomonas sp.]|nr:Atxe2 family lasso peptide isopeptidase [Sphingomonas sp.]